MVEATSSRGAVGHCRGRSGPESGSGAPAAQVRALYPDRAAFVDRHGQGPTSLSALRSILSEARQRGHATEDGEVTPGFASVAVAIALADSPCIFWVKATICAA